MATRPAAEPTTLGMYLGDGCISRNRRVWRLRVALDIKYPGIITACREAIDILMPGQEARPPIDIRYHFTNHSEDIRGIFTGALDALGIPWTRNSRYMIAIYRKAATARLDEFVGPKSAPRPDLIGQPQIPPKCG